jgi:hypothetical protein
MPVMLAFVVPSEDCKSDEEFSGKREQREKSFSLGRVPQKISSAESPLLFRNAFK